MKSLLSKSLQLIPKEQKTKFPVFLGYSLVNTLLDFVSIVYLIPVVFILLDNEKLSALSVEYFDKSVDRQLIIYLLFSLILFFVLKNIIQSQIIKKQSLFIYGISTQISKRLLGDFMQDSYSNHNTVNKNAFFRDVFQLPVVFSNNVLFSFYLLFSEILVVLFILTIGLYLNFVMTSCAFAFLILLGIILLKIQKKKVNALNSNITQLYQENVKNLWNIFYGFIDIKVTKSEEKFNQKFDSSSHDYNVHLASLTAFKQTNARYFELIFVLGISVGILFLFFKNDSVADLLFLSFFAGACIRIIPSFNKILSAYLDIKANSNVVDILSAYKIKNKQEPIKHKFNEHFGLYNVNFTYQEKSILIDINLRIAKGDFISISGSSGNGKTTLLNIIAGLLKPSNGEILIDGDQADSAEKLFDFIGYVSQQPFLFQASVLENITMLENKNADFERLDKILQSLDLSEWIDSLPNGIETPLLLESKKLSGGQKQRIALARALYAKPKILLLDEATNQLNPELEHKIFDYLKHLSNSGELTLIAVSHHHLIQQYSNKHFLIKNGKLITHE